MMPLAEQPLNPYEEQRAQRIARNNRVLEEMGVLRQASLFEAGMKARKHATASVMRGPKKEKQRPDTPIQRRTSARLAELPPPNKGLTGDEHERHGRLILEEAAMDPEHEARWAEYCNRHRCDSQARGSVYDSKAGLCCHFCRQKKLCGEGGCQRCIRRDPGLPCIGKSECSRCHAAQGRFCRACLLVRYGLQLENVRAAGETWLCPHCYEEDHPEEGWICNSSICMTRRGMRPTGIAIFEAQQKGFPSVAHSVQAQILARAGKELPPRPTTSSLRGSHTAVVKPQDTAVGLGDMARRPCLDGATAQPALKGASSPEITAGALVTTNAHGKGPPHASQRSSVDAAPAPGTPRPATPMKRPVSAELPRSEGRVQQRHLQRDMRQTMTPGAGRTRSAAEVAGPRLTRAACRKLAVTG